MTEQEQEQRQEEEIQPSYVELCTNLIEVALHELGCFGDLGSDANTLNIPKDGDEQELICDDLRRELPVAMSIGLASRLFLKQERERAQTGQSPPENMRDRLVWADRAVRLMWAAIRLRWPLHAKAHLVIRTDSDKFQLWSATRATCNRHLQELICDDLRRELQEIVGILQGELDKEEGL